MTTTMPLKRTTFLLLVAGWCGGLALAVGCAALRHQHGQHGQHGAAPASTPAPAGSPARSQAPDAEFRRLATPDQLAHVHGEIDALKQSLGQEGKYACCVEPWCNQCLLRDGECHCREQVRAEGPCCGECTEAWLDGRGAIEGVDAWELLERAKRPRDGGGPPG